MLTGNGLIVISWRGIWKTESVVLHHDYCRSIMAALTIYNYFSTPRTEDANEGREIGTQSKFWSRFASFFKKTNWDLLILLLFRLGESQLQKCSLSLLMT
jgi:PAT family beta-lactamase induction signal transducer AmpG